MGVLIPPRLSIRNTPASIAKAQKVNAALDVLEARSKPRPGLYSVLIQPQE